MWFFSSKWNYAMTHAVENSREAAVLLCLCMSKVKEMKNTFCSPLPSHSCLCNGISTYRLTKLLLREFTMKWTRLLAFGTWSIFSKEGCSCRTSPGKPEKSLMGLNEYQWVQPNGNSNCYIIGMPSGNLQVCVSHNHWLGFIFPGNSCIW